MFVRDKLYFLMGWGEHSNIVAEMPVKVNNLLNDKVSSRHFSNFVLKQWLSIYQWLLKMIVDHQPNDSSKGQPISVYLFGTWSAWLRPAFLQNTPPFSRPWGLQGSSKDSFVHQWGHPTTQLVGLVGRVKP